MNKVTVTDTSVRLALNGYGPPRECKTASDFNQALLGLALTESGDEAIRLRDKMVDVAKRRGVEFSLWHLGFIQKSE